MNTSVGTNNVKCDKGFSLLEVLIALAIFSIGVLAVASLQVSASLQSRNSSELTEASAIGSNQMEELMLRPFNDGSLSTDPHVSTIGKYSVQYTVTNSDLNGDTINESKTVDMTVSWNKLSAASPSQRQVKISFIKHNS